MNDCVYCYLDIELLPKSLRYLEIKDSNPFILWFKKNQVFNLKKIYMYQNQNTYKSLLYLVNQKKLSIEIFYNGLR